ncbi:MAG: lipid-A-disaccharide synthase [Pseudomonadales bacterium]
MTSEARTLVIGMVAGEASGDRLGAGLMREIKARGGAVRFVGIGGTRMCAEGLKPWFPQDSLSVNGFIEPLRRLPELWRLLRDVETRLLRERVDVFVGIDFNVFNLALERRLRARGVRTVHYVSPSVYAWRRGRVHRVAEAADLLLTLFPFEPPLYAGTGLRAICVGHPLADAIDPQRDAGAERRRSRLQLGFGVDDTVIALLPGSRRSEVRLMTNLMLDAARLIAQHRAEARFVIPCLNPELRDWIQAASRRYPEVSVTLVDGQARAVLTASNAAMVKSGTATLEAMLLGCPMVVTYRLGAVTHAVVRRLVRTPFVALPNILAGQALVPELLQSAATPTALAVALLQQLDRPQLDPGYLQACSLLHSDLRRDADRTAASAVLDLLETRVTAAQGSPGS